MKAVVRVSRRDNYKAQECRRCDNTAISKTLIEILSVNLPEVDKNGKKECGLNLLFFVL